MPKIVAVHGIGQQFKGDEIIHQEWWPALLSGLHLAGGDLDDPRDLSCAFYGDLFRRPGALAASDLLGPEDMGVEEAALLQLLWDEAAAIEPEKVRAPESYGARTLGRTPQLVQRALAALSKSTLFAGLSQAAMIGDLRQVVSYMNDEAKREAIRERVLEKIGPDTKVVIGHSLGSVVAYEALCCKPANVVGFMTLGSPLGIRNLIFDKLEPRPGADGTGAWPGHVQHWTNIADKGDVVALVKNLAPLFGKEVRDVLVSNGSDAHHGENYLTAKEAGQAIARDLP